MSANLETVDDGDVLIKRLPRLSAAGLLQARNEHLMVLAGSTVSAGLSSTALASLALGRAPLEVIEFVRCVFFFPLFLCEFCLVFPAFLCVIVCQMFFCGWQM